jgi:hypothetical protein
LPLIRSFFDRISSARAICGADCEKIFACADVACAREANEKSIRARKSFSDRGVYCEKTYVQKTLISSNVLQCLRDASLRVARCCETSRCCAHVSQMSSHGVADDRRKRLRSTSHCFFHFAGVNDM